MTIETPLMWVIWLIVGAITGLLLNKVLPPGRSPLLDLIMGAVGGVLGGLLFAVGGAVGAMDFNLFSVVLAIFGAGVMVGFVRLASRGRKQKVMGNER